MRAPRNDNGQQLSRRMVRSIDKRLTDISNRATDIYLRCEEMKSTGFDEIIMRI